MAILGCIMLDHSLLERVEYLQDIHFYEPLHRRVFSKIRKLYENGLATTRDALIRDLFEELNLKDSKEQNKISEHILNCFHASATAVNPEGVALLIMDMHIKRQLVDASKKTISDAYTDKRDAKAIGLVEEAEQRLFHIAMHGDFKRSFVKFDSSMEDSLKVIAHNYKNKRSIIGVTTGMADLDSKLSGLQKSDLIIIAGRPSMGKTALAVNMAVNACVGLKGEKKSVGFFSLEMSAEQLTNRIIAMGTGINSFKLRSGAINQAEYDQIVRWYQEDMRDFNFFIDDTAGLTIANLRTRARKLARRNNLGVLFIDYLQLVRGVNLDSHINKVQEISAITQELKNLAKELEIPVIALSQLSRAVEQREDKRPLLSDLRESGSIEQDADVVMFIYREEYYIRRNQPKEGTQEHEKWQQAMENTMNQAEIIIAKQRNGPIANVKLYYDQNSTVFRDGFRGKNGY